MSISYQFLSQRKLRNILNWSQSTKKSIKPFICLNLKTEETTFHLNTISNENSKFIKINSIKYLLCKGTLNLLCKCS